VRVAYSLALSRNSQSTTLLRCDGEIVLTKQSSTAEPSDFYSAFRIHASRHREAKVSGATFASLRCQFTLLLTNETRMHVAMDDD